MYAPKKLSVLSKALLTPEPLKNLVPRTLGRTAFERATFLAELDKPSLLQVPTPIYQGSNQPFASHETNGSSGPCQPVPGSPLLKPQTDLQAQPPCCRGRRRVGDCAAVPPVRPGATTTALLHPRFPPFVKISLTRAANPLKSLGPSFVPSWDTPLGRPVIPLDRTGRAG